MSIERKELETTERRNSTPRLLNRPKAARRSRGVLARKSLRRNNELVNVVIGLQNSVEALASNIEKKFSDIEYRLESQRREVERLRGQGAVNVYSGGGRLVNELGSIEKGPSSGGLGESPVFWKR